jgi:hypothetical protein
VEVVHEIPQDCARCAVTPAGLGLLNRAISGASAAPADPSKPSEPLRTPESTSNRDIPRGGREVGGVERQAL